jgi:hypothetical protein
MKRNRFNITTSVDTYKNEFANNANMSFYKNLLDFKNLNLTSNEFVGENNFDNSFITTNSLDLLGTFLKTKKSNFNESGKTQFFKNDFLFTSLSEDRVVKQHIFRKNQTLSEKKTTPILSDVRYLNTKL